MRAKASGEMRIKLIKPVQAALSLARLFVAITGTSYVSQVITVIKHILMDNFHRYIPMSSFSRQKSLPVTCTGFRATQSKRGNGKGIPL